MTSFAGRRLQRRILDGSVGETPATDAFAAGDLAASVDEALRALTVLDARALEALADSLDTNLGRMVLPEGAAEREHLRSRHWILAHLLHGTGERLKILNRISPSPSRFGRYAAEALQGVKARNNTIGRIPNRPPERFGAGG